jgi:hypothetical protein
MAKKPYIPTKRELKACDEVTREAVFQAEFFALIVEHPHTPKHINGSIRFVMIAAAEKLLARLKDEGINGQICRDVFPHAFLCAPEMMNAFQIIMDEVNTDAARVIDSIQTHALRGEVPPRMFHPHAEFIPRHRVDLVGALKKKGGTQ